MPGDGWMSGAGMTSVPKLLLGLLFVTVLSGRMTIGRWGMAAGGDLQIRLVLLAVLAIWFLLWYGATARSVVHRVSPAVALVSVHLGTLVLSGFWAQPDARVLTSVADLLMVAALAFIGSRIAAVDPRATARVLVILFLLAGLAYAGVGLLTSSFGSQGRLAVLGGGPNVFVRVVILGVIAAVAVAIERRRPAILLAAPVLAYAALLSGSRGGLSSGLVTAIIALLVYARRIRVKYVVAALAVLFAALVGVSTTGLGSEHSSVFERYSPASVAAGGYSNRPVLIERATDIFLTNPGYGGGIDSYAATYAPGQAGAYAHNYIASVAADTGLLGLAGLTVAILAVGLTFLRRARAMSATQAGLMFGGIFILLASNFSGDYYDSRLAWILFAVGLCRRSETEHADENRPRIPGLPRGERGEPGDLAARAGAALLRR